ncbi:hypothetical protein ID866_9860 [Astraeus odoratus]|nr:hypothetical protein ID866_9860 [Astraeus odoratus]
MQTLAILEHLGVTASKCGINLNDQVERDNAFRPLHGGNAIVYLGTLRPKMQRVAIKVIRLSPSGNKASIQHIAEEIQLWSKLKHENIVPVYGVLTKFDYAVSVVVKWMPMGSAYDYVQNRDIDPRPLLVGLARGLHYLHSQVSAPILHGDLRGKNVMVSEEGQALLADYGLSSLIESSFDMTAAAPIHPTVRWMAPEQVDNNGKVTAPADVWAFGMTALELFTARPPYSDVHDTRGVITSILQGPPDRPSDESTRSRMTDRWWKICSSCWVRDESLRPPVSTILKEIATMVRAAVYPYFCV